MAIHNVADKVTQIIAEQMVVDAEEVTPEASIVDDIGADSLNVIEIAMACEEEFGILEIPDADMATLARVQDLVAYIEGRLAAKK